jgi:hypothetical protein
MVITMMMMMMMMMKMVMMTTMMHPSCLTVRVVLAGGAGPGPCANPLPPSELFLFLLLLGLRSEHVHP